MTPCHVDCELRWLTIDSEARTDQCAKHTMDYKTAVVRASITRHFEGKDFVRFFDLSNLVPEISAEDLQTTILDAACRAYTLVTNAKSNEHDQIRGLTKTCAPWVWSATLSP